MIRNFFKIAWRNVLRNKAYSLINVLGLSLGLASAMLIILFTRDEISFDKFHKNGDRIYRIVNTRVNPDGSEDRSSGVTGYYHGPAFAAHLPEFTQIVRYQGDIRDAKKGTEVVREDVVNVDSNFLQVFSFPLLKGNPATALSNPANAVLTRDVAEKYFGTIDCIGKTIQITDRGEFKPYTVSAVAANFPKNSSFRGGILLPMIVPEGTMGDEMNWFNFFLNTFVVLPPGTDPAAVEQKMAQVYAANSKNVVERMAKEFNEKGSMRYLLQPLQQMHLNTKYEVGNGLQYGSDPWYSYLLSGIAIFILLIACINFVNLTIARSIKRAREIGIRKVVGSSRRQLIWQFIGESFFLTLLAFVIALLLEQLMLPTFNKLSGKSLSLAYLLDAKIIGGYIALLLLTAMLAGFYPALVLSSFQPVKTLYNRFNWGGKNILQKSLVVLQFTLATIMIIGTLTLYHQFDFMVNKPLGYDDSNIIRVENDRLSRQNFAPLKQELLANPAIVDVAPRNYGSWQTGAKINGETHVSFAYDTYGTNNIPMLGIKVLQGRNFDPSLPTDSTESVIVNELFVKEAGWKNPIGQEVNFFWDNRRMKVIGVVQDHHFASVNQKIIPQVITMFPGNPYGELHIKIKPGTDQQALAHISNTMHSQFPALPFIYQFRADANRAAYEQENNWKQMLLYGAVLTIFISCIGLFGLSVLNAEKRTKEVGIRKVLGAASWQIVTRLSRDYVALVCISLIIAFPVAYLSVESWLKNYPYRITGYWWLFGVTALCVVAIAAITISFQAVKAALANPVKSLRTE